MTSRPASWEATSQGWAESISMSNALCRWAGEVAHRTLGTQGRAVWESRSCHSLYWIAAVKKGPWHPALPLGGPGCVGVGLYRRGGRWVFT